MATEITCEQCGHKNPLGRVFCMRCGTKLNLSSLDSANRRRSHSGAGKFVGRIVRLAVTLSLLLAIILVLNPVKPAGSEGNLQDAQRLRQKLGLLKGAALDGKSEAQRISEVEINSYLLDLVKKTNRGAAPGGLYSLKTVNVAMDSGKIIVVLVTAAGPISLSYELVGTPEHTGDRQFAYHVERVRLGHMPMPGALGEWLAGKTYNVFSKMKDERELLDRMARIDVGQGEIVASTRGQP